MLLKRQTAAQDHRRLSIGAGLVADARRALYLENERTLVVADLHLAYAWAHRHAGQMLPISVREDTSDQLAALQEEYQPRRIVLLGDIVHRTVPIAALEVALREMLERLSRASEVVILRGNHDRQLETLLQKIGAPFHLQAELRLGNLRLVHGDAPELPATRPSGVRWILGHEHPAIWLGDGGVSGAKCPCFLVGEQALVLPAFSRWAAGCEVGHRPFMSPLARQATFEFALAIVGPRMVPVRLPVR